MRTFDLTSLRRRTVEIDYLHKHRHLPGTLGCLHIIAQIYSNFDPAHDVFILSKGHACAALYAVLEALGYRPDVSKVHPERDPANGITITSGSLGHGLPIAVGMAHGKILRAEPGTVHVLIGDGECQEGTTYEALNLAARLGLEGRLVVHIDVNGYQGSEEILYPIWPLYEIFDCSIHITKRGQGVTMFEKHPEKSVHLVTPADYAAILAELDSASVPSVPSVP